MIFAHSFYNSVDIAFLALFIVGFYTHIVFSRKLTFKNALFHAFACAILVDIRNVGIFLPILSLTWITIDVVIGRMSKNCLLKKCFLLVVFLLLFVSFVILLWPHLWGSPLTKFVDSLLVSTREITGVDTYLYRGRFIMGSLTPWHYNFVWILITSPITVTIFFLIGFFQIFLRNIKRVFKIDNKYKNLWMGNKEMYDSYFLYIILIIFLSLIRFNYNFDSWRHIYFVYPFIIAISLSGIYFLNTIIKKKKN